MDYDLLFAEQEGKCAICEKEWVEILPNGRKARRMHRDHNHQKLYGRGLLCAWCNIRVWPGMTADWARRAAEYLDKHEQLNERS